MGGNTGVCMGGWFRREMKSLDDLKGVKIRSLGLGGEVYRRLGATPQTTPVGEILTSLQSGLLDAAEFVGPGSDIALGLYRAGAVLLRARLQQAERHRRMHRVARRPGRRPTPKPRRSSRMPARPKRASRSPRWSGSTPRRWRRSSPATTCSCGRSRPTSIAAARRKRPRCSPSSPARSDVAKRTHDSYMAFRERTAAWSRISIKGVLDARGS